MSKKYYFSLKKIKMHKTISLILFFATISVCVNGQETKTTKTNFIDNVHFGGGINMGFGQSHSFFYSTECSL